MTNTPWKLCVGYPDGRIIIKSYRKAKAAEAAAYITKIAGPHAKVTIQRSRGVCLLWDGKAWHVIVSAVEGPVAIRMASFAAACREHDILCTASGAGVAFSR